jgi:hypothetical protein
MRATVSGLLWVALATLLGLCFAFTPAGLTGFTAAVSLIGCGLLVIGAHFRKFPRIDGFRFSISNVFLATIFLLFALRAFSRLIFVQDGLVKVLSPNNLGDICLHLAQINYFAHNPRFWPPNPIFAFDALRYPLGLNLFNAELKLVGLEPKLGLILCALLGAILTLRALFLFNGAFGVAAFLFNGGLAGFTFFQTWQLADYQAEVAWKSIPLALFVTQRGLLYAIPVGLILLVHWRRRLFERSEQAILPFWAECLLYASMPLFHLHTFLFLSFLLFWWFIFGESKWRVHLLSLVGFSIVPASLLVYFVTGFEKSSAIAWQPGWMNPPEQPALLFWLINFGIFLPLILALLVYLCAPNKTSKPGVKQHLRLLCFPAAFVFLACAFIRFAPWAWDNTKLMIWSYLLLMFCLWKAFFSRWRWFAQAPIYFLLFCSGAVSLLGGLLPIHSKEGYSIGELAQWEGAAEATNSFNPLAVFAAYPTYNHPVLVSGHRVVLGFPGHLWSHGLAYRPYEILLTRFLQGDPDWISLCRQLKVNYIFWGPFEQEHYPDSTQPWRERCPVVAEGPWGTIYAADKLDK